MTTLYENPVIDPSDYLYAQESAAALPQELNPNEERTINLEAGQVLDAVEMPDGSRQELRAVIGTETTRFGLVSCSGPDGRAFDCIVRCDPGTRSRLADVMYGDKREIAVGASDQIPVGDVRSAPEFKARFHVVEPYLQGKRLELLNYGTESIGVAEPEPAATDQPEHGVAIGGLAAVVSEARAEAPAADASQWSLSPDEFASAHGRKVMYDTITASSATHINIYAMERLITTALDPETAPLARELVTSGKVHDRPMTSDIYDPIQQRLYLADVAQRSTEAIEALTEADVAAFHGGRSSTLGSIVEFSGRLQAGARLESQEDAGILTHGGDAHSTGPASSDYIAFSLPTERGMSFCLGAYAQAGLSRERSIDDLEADIAALEAIAAQSGELERNRERAATFAEGMKRSVDYIRQHPDSDYAALTLDDFPVVFGATYASVVAPKDGQPFDNELFYSGSKDLAEVRPNRLEQTLQGEQPDIPVIAVPRDRIEKVGSILHRRGYHTKVIAIEDLAVRR